MRRLSILVLLVVAPSLVACSFASNVRNLKFTKDNHDTVMQQVKKSRDLTGEEVGLLLAATLRDAVAGGVLDGKTVGEVIEGQKKFNAEAEAQAKEQKRLADEARQRQEEAKKRQEAVIATMVKDVTLTVYEKGFRPRDIDAGEYQDYFWLRVSVHNGGDKDVRAFRGMLYLKDLFGIDIMSKPLIISDESALKSGATKDTTWFWEYNRFFEDQRRLVNTSLANMKVEWKPTTILFTDGTKLDASSNGD